MIRRTMIALALAAALVAAPVLAADDWEMPRTPWGHPDLQGLWTNTTLTPFERPVEMGDKEFLTEEEVAQAEAARQAMIENRAEQPAQKAEAGQNVGAYNLHWLELGTKIVGSRRTSLVVDPPNGRVPVRPEAQQVRADDLVKMFDSYEHMSVWDRCITRGVPGHLFPAGYNNNYRIAQTPEYVVIYSEMINDIRFIPVDGRERLPEDLFLWNGDSRGHWDGDTLVVETKNFSDKGWIATSGSQGRIKGIPVSTELVTVERFTRIDEETVDWTVTIDDPVNYTDTWTVNIPLYFDPDNEMFEYACHEGNWAVTNTLSGARHLEKTGGNSSL